MFDKSERSTYERPRTDLPRGRFVDQVSFRGSFSGDVPPPMIPRHPSPVGTAASVAQV